MAAVSKEYGGALFLLAEETGQLEEFRTALQQLCALFHSAPKYLPLLSSPNIPREERVSAVRTALSGNVPTEISSFVQLLTQRGHIGAFFDCVEEYESRYNYAMGISVAEVVSAVPLTDTEKHTLQTQLEKHSGHRVRLECSVDPALMGGITVRMDGKYLDGSLRRRLEGIKDVMSQ